MKLSIYMNGRIKWFKRDHHPALSYHPYETIIYRTIGLEHEYETHTLSYFIPSKYDIFNILQSNSWINKGD